VFDIVGHRWCKILDKYGLVALRAALMAASIALAACSAIRIQPRNDPSLDGGPTVLLYVARRGWHVDIGFASVDLAAPLTALGANFPGARYLMFGFGDRRYLLAHRHHGPQLLEALWPGAGLLLVTGLSAPPATAFGAGNVLTLRVYRAQLLSAQAFLAQSLSQRALLGQSDAAGPYAGSLFFGATQYYSALHTCNTWVAEALHAARLPVQSRGVVFAAQIWGQVGQLAGAELGGNPKANEAP
jgi:hypothetical protein